MIDILRTRLAKGILSRDIPLAGYERLGKELNTVIAKRFGRSLHIREVDTASCGACESEIIAANNPIYDIQRFGVNFVASPRHADAILVTGALSKNMVLALQRTYAAMPDPKWVITLGDCALDCGKFKGSYYLAGPIAKVLPVDLHIPGCPPEPIEIVKHLLVFLRQTK